MLLEKDLMVLEKGIREGRKTYANMIKYIKIDVYKRQAVYFVKRQSRDPDRRA